MAVFLAKTANQISPRCAQGSSRGAHGTTLGALGSDSPFPHVKCPILSPAHVLLSCVMLKFTVRRMHSVVFSSGHNFSEDLKSNLSMVHSRVLVRFPRALHHAAGAGWCDMRLDINADELWTSEMHRGNFRKRASHHRRDQAKRTDGTREIAKSRTRALLAAVSLLFGRSLCTLPDDQLA